eukprot:jgi/Undpi1/12917/HiC_scaffold_7.g02583.m1
MTWLIYINYYVDDGGLQVCGCACTCCTTGDHPYDLEVVVVEVDPNSKVSGVFYAPHSGHEHFWIRDHDDIDEIMGGEGGDGYRPEVFISRGKHANYPVSGKIARIFGFANDRCMDPVASDYPFVPLSQAAIELDLIDNVYPGPSTKINRDWSVAPEARLAENVDYVAATQPALIGLESGKFHASSGGKQKASPEVADSRIGGELVLAKVMKFIRPTVAAGMERRRM